MIDIDYTLWIQLVNFIVLIFILNVLLYKPILGIMEKRKQQFDGARDEVRTLHESVEKKMAEYEEAVRKAKQAAMEQKAEYVKEGAEEARKIVDAVRGVIPKMMEEFQGKMNREIEEARGVLKNQSQRLSLEIAEKVLGRSLQ
ncbi:MAG TPA: ATP synthase F0 subunit B [Syntrophales bacterium]|nr:ATP synthase F0 subunit B [Syntrophales bacterium]